MLTLRAARWYDAFFVLRLRNDATTRRWSPDSSPIGILHHLRWWFGPGCGRGEIFIGCLGHTRVSYVRFDERADGLWEISVAVHPSKRGLGVGKATTRLAIEAHSIHPGVMGWRAHIHQHNVASMAVFSGLGFEVDKQASAKESFVTTTLPVSPSHE